MIDYRKNAPLEELSWNNIRDPIAIFYIISKDIDSLRFEKAFENLRRFRDFSKFGKSFSKPIWQFPKISEYFPKTSDEFLISI